MIAASRSRRDRMPMIRSRPLPRSLVVAVAAAASTLGLAAQDAGKESVDAKKDAAAKTPPGLTLEKLFPEDGLFGPEATGMAFAADGGFAAWLYRPLRERRHGSDLYL